MEAEPEAILGTRAEGGRKGARRSGCVDRGTGVGDGRWNLCDRLSRQIKYLFRLALLLAVGLGLQLELGPTSGLALGRPGAEVDPLAYLQRYGYMNGTQGNANLISEEAFNEAVMSFQRFAGLPETGLVDSQTVRLMQMPRCGNKDRSGRAEGGKRRRRKRRKRYALQGSKWRRQQLSYRISQYPSRFSNKKEQVDAQMEKAFSIWSKVAPIDFVAKREGRVHIEIRFASGEHGDGDPFDGPGNTLAHAYFPQYGGDAHFDDQEFWTVDSYAGTNIFQVAAHELGHSLGLGHSSVREALMAPFYQKYKPNFKLHPDDVLGIQALYGDKSDADADAGESSAAPSSTSTTSTPAPPPQPPSRRPALAPEPADEAAPDLCQSGAIDAITRTEDGTTYVFRGQHYWQLQQEGVAPGFPARIGRDWDGLPGNLDAALTWSDGKTFFFKGDKYWRFHNRRREPGYPKLISAGFAGIPNNVDAAFVWSGNGKTYFTKRDKYWRFDSKQEPPVSAQYPKPLKNWSGLPAGGVDAAFKWENGLTYFFKGDRYFRFDDRNFEVDSSARPAFPRASGPWWFGCESGQQRAASLEQPGLPSASPSPSPSRSLLAGLGSLLGQASSPGEWTFLGAKASEEEGRAWGRPRGQAGSPAADQSRWSFSFAGSPGGEQSSSELRLLGPVNETSAESQPE